MSRPSMWNVGRGGLCGHVFRSRRLVLVGFALVWLASSSVTRAAVITWSGSSTSFDSTASWVGGVVPGASDTAFFDIDLGFNDTVEFPSSPTNAQLDVTDGHISLKTELFGSTQTYTITGDADITAGSSVQVGVFVNDPDMNLAVGGTLRVEGNSSFQATQASTITTQDLFEFVRGAGEGAAGDGGDFVATGLVPTFVDDIAARGIRISREMFQRTGF